MQINGTKREATGLGMHFIQIHKIVHEYGAEMLNEDSKTVDALLYIDKIVNRIDKEQMPKMPKGRK